MAERQLRHSTQAGNKTQQSKWPLAVTFILIAALVASYVAFPGFKGAVNDVWQVLASGNKARISAWVGTFGFWGPMLLVVAMVAQMFLVVVNVVLLMLVAILVYGPMWGSVLAVGAVLVASTVGYFLGRSVGQAGVSKLIGHKAEQKVTHFIQAYGIWAVIIARISPVLSNDAVSFVAGLTGMNYWRFIAATTAGIVPLTILLAWLGENNQRLTAGLIWVTAGSLVLFLAYIVFTKYQRKSKV